MMALDLVWKLSIYRPDCLTGTTCYSDNCNYGEAKNNCCFFHFSFPELYSSTPGVKSCQSEIMWSSSPSQIMLLWKQKVFNIMPKHYKCLESRNPFRQGSTQLMSCWFHCLWLFYKVYYICRIRYCIALPQDIHINETFVFSMDHKCIYFGVKWQLGPWPKHMIERHLCSTFKTCFALRL